MITDFNSKSDGTGTREWSDYSLNIAKGCQNNCRYCFAKEMAIRYKRKTEENWQNELLTKKATIDYYPKKDGIVMFPTTHDITPFNVKTYCRVLEIVLSAGNKVLITSKPNLECITQVLKVVKKYRHNVLFRFTIGTINETTAKFWEPGAPSIEERLTTLQKVYKEGFNTSISIEPLLGGVGTALSVFSQVVPLVTHDIWVGKLNKARQRVDCTDPLILKEVERIEKLQSDFQIKELYDSLKDYKMIKWSDSVTKILKRDKGKNK